MVTASASKDLKEVTGATSSWVGGMPPRGYANLSVRVETREKLRRLMEERGLATLSDAIEFLLDAYQRCEVLADVEARLRKVELLLARLVEECGGGRGSGWAAARQNGLNSRE